MWTFCTCAPRATRRAAALRARTSLRGEHPCDLGERCTVFIETAIVQAEGGGSGSAAARRADGRRALCRPRRHARAAGPAGHPDVGGADAARGADIRPPPPAAEIVWRPWEARCASPRSARGFWTPSSARAIRSPVYPSARCSGATTAPPHRSSSSAGRSGSRSSPAPSAAPEPSAPIPRSSSRRPTAASRTSRAIGAATATPRRWNSARTPTRCSTACRAMRIPPSSSS